MSVCPLASAVERIGLDPTPETIGGLCMSCSVVLSLKDEPMSVFSGGSNLVVKCIPGAAMTLRAVGIT